MLKEKIAKGFVVYCIPYFPILKSAYLFLLYYEMNIQIQIFTKSVRVLFIVFPPSSLCCE